MSKKQKITLNDDGEVYRDDKLIAVVNDDKTVKWKHWTYKSKHADEVDALMSEYDSLDAYNTPDESEEADLDDGGELVEDCPVTPAELFLKGNGKWWGEESPYVVDWRKKHWSKKAFDAKYAHQSELLANNYEAEGMTYEG